MKAVETLLNNHLYLFDGKVYRQTSGGPIDDNVSNLAARLVMYAFTMGYLKTLTKLDLEKVICHLKIYVDNCNQAGTACLMEPGTIKAKCTFLGLAGEDGAIKDTP